MQIKFSVFKGFTDIIRARYPYIGFKDTSRVQLSNIVDEYYLASYEGTNEGTMI